MKSPDYDSHEGQIDESVSNLSMRLVKRLSIAFVAVVLLSSIVVVTDHYELRHNADLLPAVRHD